MPANTLSILKPSVNNLTARIFVRAAGLEFEELDVWGKKSTPEFLAKDPADLTPLLEEEGLPKGALWESCAIMQYLCNKHGLDQFYPTDPGERAMVDSAMFYLIGTFYPLLARATYPTLGFGQYPGEVATSEADDAMKAKAQKDAAGGARGAARGLPRVLPRRPAVHRRRQPVDRGHAPGGHARVPPRGRLRVPRLDRGVHEPDGGGPRRRVLGAGGRRARLRRVGQGARVTLTTTVVGSYPQPDWLIDRERLGARLPPRVRALELWRVDAAFLEEAQDDATRLAVQDMERAGVDVITDGEMRRESYSNRFATALDGVDLDEPGVALDRTGHENPVPRVVGPIRRTRPVEVGDVEFLRALTDRRIKITVPGPFTMTQQAQDDHYGDGRSLALAYAEAVNEELRDLKAAGADVVQIDEPYLQARPEPAREYALEAIDRALDGIEGDTVLHTCFGYAHIVKQRLTGYPFLRELDACRATHVSLEAAQPGLDPEVLRELPSKVIVLGVLDLGSPEAETPEAVAERIRRALEVVEPERLVVAPDCGMKYLPRDLAFRKLEAMVAGARIVRDELGG